MYYSSNNFAALYCRMGDRCRRNIKVVFYVKMAVNYDYVVTKPKLNLFILKIQLVTIDQ